MALLGNYGGSYSFGLSYYTDDRSPGRQFGGKENDRGKWCKSGSRLNIWSGAASSFSKHCGAVEGYRAPYTSLMPRLTGGLATRHEAAGNGAATSSVASGVGISATIAGESSLAESVNLLTNLVSSIAGSGNITAAHIRGIVELVASLAGSGAINGSAVTAVASLLAPLEGNGAVTAATISALAGIAASVVPYTELSPQGLATSVWNKAIEAEAESGTYGALMPKLLTSAKYLGLKDFNNGT